MAFTATRNILGRRRGSRSKVKKKQRRTKPVKMKVKISGTPAQVKKAVKTVIKTDENDDIGL